ncbi:serine hydrolase [Streptacidiphilus sp. N1-10]|uniref:Serine hydrolase n=1 Tax=Streptacidiphilus jeojiensis TaxID=3229225 RepID=A0ABV6XZ73_9ACTN
MSTTGPGGPQEQEQAHEHGQGPGRRGRAGLLRSRAAIGAAVVLVVAVATTTTMLHGHGAAAQNSSLVSAASSSSDSASAPGATTVVSASAAASAAASASASTSAEASAQPSATSSEAAMDQLEKAASAAEGKVAVAATDLTTGAALDYGDTDHGFVTASIAKMDILATLLLQAQDDDRTLTSSQRSLATRMIENSDNTAADSLYQAIGESSGLDAANKRFGLTETEGGSGLYWGLTTTSAADQLRLLRQVFTSSSVLSSASRSYEQGLMSQVETDQRWGVSAAATSSDFALKNGWLPRSATGLWVINSVGRVSRNGHLLLISVVSDGNLSESGGISLVESMAKAAAETLDQS